MRKICSDEEGIKLAISLAKENPTEKYKVASVIINKRGMVVSMGYNSITKTHPIQAHYAKKSKKPHKVYLHAEIGALVKCRDVEPHTIYVARVWKDGTPSIAKPCNLCSLAIAESGISRVVYTMTDRDYIIQEVKQL